MGDVRRLIAFDLDGTLVDSHRDLAESANALVGELGGRALPVEDIGRMVGEGAGLLVRRALAAAGLDAERPGALDRFLAIYGERLLNHTRPYPGVLDVVSRARSRARVAVLTNKPLGPTVQLLDGLGIRDLFDDVVGGDGPLPRKPDPAALLAMMAAHGVPGADTLMVGDSRFDRETAQRAGARCCLVSYGFGFHTVSDDPRDAADWVVPDVEGLGRVLDRFTEARVA